MGQTASSQRDREDFLNRDSRRFSQIVQNRGGRPSLPSRLTSQQTTTRPSSTLPPTTHQTSDSHTSPPIATFSRQISAQSIPFFRNGAENGRNISTRDEIFYEQHEERPLVNMEDLGMRNAPITHITASPMPRRSSRLARLSSLMVPRYAATGSSGDDQQAQGEGRSLRRRLSNAHPSSTTHEAGGLRSRRVSILGSFPPRSPATPRTRQRRELTQISRPYPLSPDASLPPSGFETSPLRGAVPARTPSTGPSNPPSRFWSFRDNSRLSRVRRSISLPFEALLPTTHSGPTQDRGSHTPPQRPSRLTPTHDPGFQLPPLNIADPSINLDAPGLEPSSPARVEQRLSGISTVSESPERMLARADGPSWTERWAERGSTVRRESRRMPSMLRGRSSRLIRRDNEGPLPRILHLAAAAIAAQLSGTPEQPVPDMQAIGPDDLDGSLHNLFRTLQTASNLTSEPRNQEGGQDPSRQPGALPPLNFLRVFRFVSQGPSTERRPRASDRLTVESASDDADGRTVTLVVVGVRSVPSDASGHEDAASPEPNLTSLLNLPGHAPSTNVLRNGANGLLRHANPRARFPHRRRASIGGLNTFPANYDSQRHQRAASSASVQSPMDVADSATPLVLSESPPGPHPPPSTPADPSLSAHSSATTTPSRRPSSASAIQQPPVPSRDIATQHLREAGISALEDQATRVQQRRRSDSEFARHRDLGAGAARRNGVVEPDEADTGDVQASGSRSWLIYVVGTNLSEDHPALTTPGLFTDVSPSIRMIRGNAEFLLMSPSQNPTYEDLLLLSSLLGPAKPPVASHEDVASACGTFRVSRDGDMLVAAAIQGVGKIQIAPNERCLVCLEDYQAAEELRQLAKCSHLFHRECIDQVSLISPFIIPSLKLTAWCSGLLQAAIHVRSVEVKALTKEERGSQRINSRLRPVGPG